MPAIINKLPFSGRDSTVTVRGQSVVIKRHQIIIWVSLAELGLSTLHPETPRFPALLDSGCNHNLIILEQQLREWAGIHPQCLPRARNTRLFGEHVPQFAANIWLHANEPSEIVLRTVHHFSWKRTRASWYFLRRAPRVYVSPCSECEHWNVPNFT